MKIYTKTGDDGTTSLFSGGRVSKTHLRVEAYGTIDELNSVLGVARAHHPHARTDAWLTRVQRQLFNLGADLATPPNSKADWVVRMDADTVIWLEQAIDEMTAELPELRTSFCPVVHLLPRMSTWPELSAVAPNELLCSCRNMNPWATT